MITPLANGTRYTSQSKIFGIGLNKTGTTTLASCFVTLGFKHLSCRPDLLSNSVNGKMHAVFEVIDAFQSFEDWPYPLIFRELFFKYPDAMFILTVRKSPATWLESLKRHSLRTNPYGHCRLLSYPLSYPHGAEKRFLDFYESHNLSVRQFFRAQEAEERLLVLCWETGDGWPELCNFLGVPRPNEPIPHANKGSDTKPTEFDRRENLRLIGLQIGLLYPHLQGEMLAEKIREATGETFDPGSTIMAR